jgi:hypothetical protein
LAEFLIIIIIIYVFYLIGLDQIGLVLNLLDLNFNLIIAFHQEKKKKRRRKILCNKKRESYLFICHSLNQKIREN